MQSSVNIDIVNMLNVRQLKNDLKFANSKGTNLAQISGILVPILSIGILLNGTLRFVHEKQQLRVKSFFLC